MKIRHELVDATPKHEAKYKGTMPMACCHEAILTWKVGPCSSYTPSECVQRIRAKTAEELLTGLFGGNGRGGSLKQNLWAPLCAIFHSGACCTPIWKNLNGYFNYYLSLTTMPSMTHAWFKLRICYA
jgi:hypothetical protein